MVEIWCCLNVLYSVLVIVFILMFRCVVVMWLISMCVCRFWFCRLLVMLVSVGVCCRWVSRWGVYMVSVLLFGLVRVNWYWVWLIWFLMFSFCIGCRYRWMFGICVMCCCSCVMIVCVLVLCCVCGLSLISSCLLLSVVLLLFMLMNEDRLVMFLLVSSVEDSVCWCCVIVWNEIDCGVLLMFWISLVFCIGKKFLGIYRYSIVVSSRVVIVVVSISGWCCSI